MKTFFTNLPKIIATILGLVVAVFIVVAIINSLFLFKFENQFETNEKLSGTECRDTISACGDLAGTDDFTYITKIKLLRHDNIKLGFHIFYYLMKK